AQRVSVVGDWNGWDHRRHPMRRLGSAGLWELFVPGVVADQTYKYDLLDAHGERHQKADPVGAWCEVPPKTASKTFTSTYRWGDDAWMAAHAERDVRRGPMATYEVHLGSWKAGGGTSTNYRDLVADLVAHVRALGFDTIELLPVAEHPYYGSWGYQVTGYFAPTARYGDPDDFRYFVDICHQNGIGVIVDWVPAHFVKDAHGLGRFDGTALYEHEDPRRGEHPDWGTYIFNYDRVEVKNFLVANALYWLEEFHVDGLRVDAVASMLYLDYSREDGEWIPNAQGGRENFGAIALLREVNRLVREHYPGRYTIAEESTAFAGVTRSPERGGLGFTFKWNMGWMHDTLGYFQADPLFRSHHHDQLTFAMVYEHSEAFVNPLSHDEVVHGKGSLYTKMPGDGWRQRADLRTLLTYQFARPGKVLLFMGVELASPREWNHETGLDWYLLDEPEHRAHRDFVAELAHLYQAHPCLWRLDHDPSGFEWIACHDRGHSVFSFVRWDDGPMGDPQRDHVVVVLNMTPVPRHDYRIGAPRAGAYRVLLDSNAERFGGSGYDRPDRIETEAAVCDGRSSSLLLTLPPASALILEPA
ncbi:MAG: 1,4-alpha-glucan branching protein GlgB, partial [Acidobacteriota bacterium]